MNKEEKLQLTKNKLIDSTVYLMENMDNLQNVTSREIANKADCKPAMINYCFGSRENLIFLAFQSMYQNYLTNQQVEKLIQSDLTSKDLLKELHFIVAKYLIEHFNFTKAITGYILFQRDLGKEAFSYPYVLKHYHGKRTEEECKVIAYELSTMMQLIVFRKDDIKNDFGIDLENDEELRKIISMRVDLLLGE